MSMPMNIRGFTLIELVIVMAIMAILSIFSVQFITNSVQIYKQGSDREQLMSDIRFGIERLNREVRNAVPGSLRLENIDESSSSANAECVRFWPIETGRRYNNIATTSTDTQVTMPAGDLTVDDFEKNWLIIFPTDLDSSEPREGCGDNNCAVEITLAPEILVKTLADGQEVKELKFTFSEKLDFAASSFKRLFFAKQQVRYCVTEQKLTRDTAAIGEAFSSSILMAENIIEGTFNTGENDLYQMLGFDLTANRNNETIKFSHKIRLYNAP